MKYELDATNQSLGRLASKIAVLLRGKSQVSYKPDVLPNNQVIIKNLSGIRFTGKKLSQKKYYHYSGYHSGIKARKLSDLWKTKPEQVLREMTYRMLPKNKTRDKIIKNLKFN